MSESNLDKTFNLGKKTNNLELLLVNVELFVQKQQQISPSLLRPSPTRGSRSAAATDTRSRAPGIERAVDVTSK